MGGVRFLGEELSISIVMLGVMIATYIIFLAFSLYIRNGPTSFLRFLAFIQMLVLYSIPFILTFLVRRGLTNDHFGVRLLEEVALHGARYKVFIRPLMGYVGVYIDGFALRLICNRNNRTFLVSNAHDAACERASTPMNESWISIFGGQSSPVIAWISVEKSLRTVLQTLTGPGTIRTDFGIVSSSDLCPPPPPLSPPPKILRIPETAPFPRFALRRTPLPSYRNLIRV